MIKYCYRSFYNFNKSKSGKMNVELFVKLLLNQKMLVSNGDGDVLLETKNLRKVVKLIAEDFPVETEFHVLEFQRRHTSCNGIKLIGFSSDEELKFNRLLSDKFYREHSPIEKEIWEE
ncbi:MAG TPA: hypothetical protein PLN57_00765 [bacterium]|jgi:hypothetical protein|nr:hypothetical protein [bacterium]